MCIDNVKDKCGASRKRSFSEARGVVAWMVTETGQHTLADLARRMNRDPSAFSMLAKKIRMRMANEADFKMKIERMLVSVQSNNSITHA